MLKTIEIKNGVMTPKYDLYNDYYTVTIEEHINKLDIYYELEKNVSVNILGNENITDEISQVTINLNSGEVRLFLFIGIFFGMVIYFLTLSNLYVIIFGVFVKTCKKFIQIPIYCYKRITKVNIKKDF